MTDERRFASIQHTAEYADVNVKTIRRRISDGSLTGYRMGPRLIRVDLREVDALLRPIASAEDMAKACGLFKSDVEAGRLTHADQDGAE